MPEPSSTYAAMTIDAHRDSLAAELDVANFAIDELATNSLKLVEDGTYTLGDAALELDVFVRVLEVGTHRIRATIERHQRMSS